jgi:phenylacetate-CoA ligase
MRLPARVTTALYRGYAKASPWYRAGRLSHYLRLMREANRWTTGELEAFQLGLLSRLLDCARETHFYRPRLEQSDLSRGLRSVEQLSALPVLTKADVNHNPADFWAPRPARFVAGATSGTTGTPMRVRVTAEMDAAGRAARWRSIEWYAIPFGAPTVNFKGGNDARDRKLALSWALASAVLGQTLRDAFRYRFQENFELLQRVRPRVVLGYPNVLVELAASARAAERSLAGLGVELVVLGGESISPAQRDRVSRAFACPVASLYASHEGNYMAMECPQGGLHVQETVLLEIVDEQGQRVPPGVQGEVVITPLLGTALPLLRYQLGDRGRLLPDRCACGRVTPTLALDVCRTADLFELREGERVSSQVFQPMIHNAFGLHFGVDPRSYRVVHIGPDELEFQLVMPEGVRLPDAAGDFVQRLVRERLGTDVRTRVVELPVLVPDASGKRRCFIPRSEADAYRAAPARPSGGSELSRQPAG